MKAENSQNVLIIKEQSRSFRCHTFYITEVFWQGGNPMLDTSKIKILKYEELSVTDVSFKNSKL